MNQRDRDRLVALKKAKERLITQAQAAEEMGVSERHVRRLLKRMRKQADRVVIHGLRGKPSNRRLKAETRERMVAILSGEVYRGFGPTLASEYLDDQHGIQVGPEALRQVMTEAGLWRPKPRKAVRTHVWRERKARFGEMLQWDTSNHDWLEGRGERIYLIHRIDDATSRLLARLVGHDSTEENMRLLGTWLERYGRPLAVYTDKDSMFHNAPKHADGAEVKQMPPTQIGRALGELRIAALLAHSPQAKGRVERSFQTAQDRLVKGLRVAGACTIQAANHYLEREFLPWWEAHCTVVPASADDAHRALEAEHDLKAVLSQVRSPLVTTDYTFRFAGRVYRIDRADVKPGLRGAHVRMEQRLDGSLAVRFGEAYLRFAECPQPVKVQALKPPAAQRNKPPKPTHNWMKGFKLQDAPTVRELNRRGLLNRF